MFGSHLTSWWALVLRGVVSIVFGILAIALAPMTVTALFVLAGIWLVLMGIGAVFSGVSARSRGRRSGFLIGEGVLTILAGLVLWIWPGLSSVALLFVVAAWAVIVGVMQLSRAFRAEEREWSRGLMGLASIALGALLFANPMAGAVALSWLIGIYAIIAGVLDIVVAFRLHAPRARRHATV